MRYPALIMESPPASPLHQVLVVGCGSIGERHLRCFLSTGRARAAVCDTNASLAAEVAARYGVLGFDCLQDAEAAFPADAWIICTPAHTHLSLLARALRGGRHVLCEKPLSTGLDGVEEVRALINSSGRHVAVAYVFHAMPWIYEPRAALLAGEIGQPMHAAVLVGQNFPSFRPAYRDIYYARHDTGGGAIQDGLTHQANFMEWMLGPTTRLYCDAAHQVLEGVTVEDTVNIAARNGPVMVSYAHNQFQAPNEVEVRIHGTKGSLMIQMRKQRWGRMLMGETDWTWHTSPPMERDAWFVRQAQEFLNGMEGQPSTLATFDEAVQTLKFNLAALESARTGKVVEIA